jgi:hypothetical protein
MDPTEKLEERSTQDERKIGGFEIFRLVHITAFIIKWLPNSN